MKKASIIIIGSLLIGLSMLGIWLAQRQPTNADGLPYRAHFLTAAVSSEEGVLTFNDVRVDTFRIYMRGDTLVVEQPDTTFVIPGITNPSPALPLTYTVKVPISTVLIMDLTPSHFHSIYKFPGTLPGLYKFEVWAGTEPGGDPVDDMSDSADVYITPSNALVFGWTAISDTVNGMVIVVDSVNAAGIFSVERNEFVVVDTIPKAFRDTTEVNP